MTFADALALASGPSEKTTWNVPDGWQQGRGAFGGLTFAVLATAAREGLADREAPLRTLTGEIPAAVVVGPAEVRVRTLRQGRALSTMAAEIEQGGAVVAHAVLGFGKTRPVAFDPPVPRVTVPSYEDARPVDVGSLGPTFVQYFEYRPVKGIPYTGAERPEVTGWVRMLAPGDVPAAIALIAMADAWYPSVLPLLTEPRPFGTISFALHLFDRGFRPGEPLFHRSHLLGAQEGYFVEVRELFTAQGELAAYNQQTLAIIK